MVESNRIQLTTSEVLSLLLNFYRNGQKLKSQTRVVCLEGLKEVSSLWLLFKDDIGVLNAYLYQGTDLL